MRSRNAGAEAGTRTVSRRQVLVFAGLMIGSGVVELAGPAAPALGAPPTTPASGLTLEPIANEPVTVLSPDSATAGVCPRQLAVKVLNNGVALPSGTQIKLTFDSRLHTALDQAILTVGTRVVSVSTEITEDEETSAST